MSGELGPDERLQFVADHHKTSVDHQRDYIRRRDSLFGYALLATAALCFRASYRSDSELVIVKAIQRLLGIDTSVDVRFLVVLLWFVFFSVVSRYFQAVMTVERQYGHIASVEREIAHLYGSQLLARESVGYLAEYPLFSTWMHSVYTWVFPLSVVGITLWAGIGTLGEGLGWPTDVFATCLALATLASAGLYVYSSKWERRSMKPAPVEPLRPVPQTPPEVDSSEEASA